MGTTNDLEGSLTTEGLKRNPSLGKGGAIKEFMRHFEFPVAQQKFPHFCKQSKRSRDYFEIAPGFLTT